jgi:hypothetical protein
LELIYGFNIPDALAENTNLTIGEFGNRLSRLPIIPSVLYPEFFELKTDMIEAVIRLYKIKTGLEEGTEEEVKVINKCLDLIEENLKYVTAFSIN